MIVTTFQWCVEGRHSDCRGEYPALSKHVFGGAICDCPCHHEKVTEKAPETSAPAPQETINSQPSTLNHSSSESVLAEAERIINGPRRDSYGPVEESFAKIAKGWSVLANADITPKQVCMMMVWLKVCRFNNKADRDSIVDICGYAALTEKL